MTITAHSFLPTDRPLVIAGLGHPLIDFITPNEKEFEASRNIVAWAEALANKETDEAVRTAIENGRGRIDVALTALKEFHQFIVDEGCVDETGHPKVSKMDLKPEHKEKLDGWFHDMVEAAKDINRCVKFVNEQNQLVTQKLRVAVPTPLEEVRIRYTGGTMTNKFHAINGALGPNVATYMLGAMGEEDETGNQLKLQTSLKDSGIIFRSFVDAANKAIEYCEMPVSYIMQFGKKDRVPFKAPVDPTLTPTITRQKQQAADFARTPAPGATPDIYFIEGSDLSIRKFGREVFDTFNEVALTSGKPIVFSPPTDEKLVISTDPALSDPAREAILKNRAAMDRIIDHPSTRLMTMNESEAVAMFCDEAIHKNGEHITENPQLKRALAAIQDRLRAKKAASPESPEPLAFVSVGPPGAIYITADKWDFIPSAPAKEVVNSIGAGDAFASGVFVEYLRQMKILAATGVQEFGTEALETITKRGEDLGRACVEYKGAELPLDDIATVLGTVPTGGNLARPVAKEQPKKGVV